MNDEQAKMLAGELYDPTDPALVAGRDRAAALCRRYNQLDAAAAADERQALLAELFGAATETLVTAPFFCDYGSNIRLGNRVYFNFNCVILDVAPVSIGDNVLFGPGVHIYTALHPLRAVERRAGLESPACEHRRRRMGRRRRRHLPRCVGRRGRGDRCRQRGDAGCSGGHAGGGQSLPGDSAGLGSGCTCAVKLRLAPLERFLKQRNRCGFS